jgi:hypothetical protein
MLRNAFIKAISPGFENRQRAEIAPAKEAKPVSSPPAQD